MGASKYIKQSFETTYKTRSDAYRKRLQKWRKEPAVTRVENPTNLVRAHELGYKAKKGYIIVRVRNKRGKRARPRPDLGRKPAKNRAWENPGKPWQWYAERKAERDYPNMVALNSYWIAEDGSNQYHEVIMKTRETA